MRTKFKPLLWCLLLSVLGSCGESAQKTFKIGVSQPSRDEWRDQMNNEMQREMLFHDDAALEIRTAHDNDSLQEADINYFIDNGFDAIIVAPNKADALVPVIKKARSKGIQVIVFDRALGSDDFTAYIDLDNVGIGREAGECVVHYLGNKGGNVVEIRGLDGSSPANQRHSGFISTLEHDSLHRLILSVTANWKEGRAFVVMDSILSSRDDVDLVYAHNDGMAIGAAKAAEKHNRPDIIIIGTDAAPVPGISAVRDGVIDASIIYPTDGHRVIRRAMDILHKKPFNRIEHVPSMTMVDKSNADLLLRQSDLLRDRTDQLERLNQLNIGISDRNTTQKWLLYSALVVLILLVTGLFLLVRMLRQRKRYENVMAEKNRQLEVEHEKQLELYGQLEDATKSKLAFFTNVSHDLRTPLTLICEPVEQVAKSGTLSPSNKSLIDVALRNAKILRRMIEEILEFRRIENGKSEIAITPFDIFKYIHEWSESFRTIAQKRGLRFNVDVEEGYPVVLTDSRKIERIFHNLLSNALKFTPTGGSIAVSASISEGKLIIKVTDTGIGMDEEEKTHVFDRFYQANRLSASGSGIGLSLTKNFVELLGGTISLKSKLGEGSTFEVNIPVVMANKNSDYNRDNDSEELTDAGLGNELIHGGGNSYYDTSKHAGNSCADHSGFDKEKPLVLVVDDNADLRSLVVGMLEPDFNVIEAEDGRVALKLALRYVPDIVVCDVMMPRMDGLELCLRIKSERATSHIPVLMVTARSLDEQRLEGYDSGADGYITKPFTEDLLLSRLRNLLDNRQRIYRSLLEYDPKLNESDFKHRKLPASRSEAVENEFYSDFLGAIRNNFANPDLSISDLSSELGIGATQLSRKIKALNGKTPVDILREYRLNEARALLISTERPISEIAYSVGFGSPQYFAKCFRDAFGTTPTEIRKK